MSVAFRRDSDEEHLEPRFELPIPPGPNLVTARGLRLIEQRVADLEAALDTAPSPEATTEVQRDLRYWRARLATAQLAPSANGETVAIGARVTIRQDGRERVLDIVGHDESDPAQGRIAFAAPLAKAMIGCEPDDEVDAPGPGGAIVVVAVDMIPLE